MSDGRRAEAVDWIGEGLDEWMVETSPMDVFSSASPGVWVWEGHVEGEREFRRLIGSYRVLTDQEWEAWIESMQAVGDLGLWNEGDWLE